MTGQPQPGVQPCQQHEIAPLDCPLAGLPAAATQGSCSHPAPAGQVCLSSQVELGSCEEVAEGPSLVGEAALLGANLGHPCHLHTLRTQTRCKLWRLTTGGFLAALRFIPQMGGEGSERHTACTAGGLPGGSCGRARF